MLPISCANAATTGGDFWKNCPGAACPANAPDEKYGATGQAHREYEQMDSKRLRKERERHEDSLKKIQREEKKRDDSR
jgi:hypothetical protein